MLQTGLNTKSLFILQVRFTNNLNHTIPENFNHLIGTYWNVTPNKLKDLTTSVKSPTLPPSESVDTLFFEFDDLAAVAEIDKSLIMAPQKISMAYILFSKQYVHKSTLCKWVEDCEDDQKWENFKEHLCVAYKSLRRNGALTIKDNLDCDDVMKLVSAGIINAFHNMKMDYNSFVPNTTTNWLLWYSVVGSPTHGHHTRYICL